MMVDGYWLPSNRCDPRAIALYMRHYSVRGDGCWDSPAHGPLPTTKARARGMGMRLGPRVVRRQPGSASQLARLAASFILEFLALVSLTVVPAALLFLLWP